MPARISLKSSSETILDGACAYHLTALEIDPEASFLVKNFAGVTEKLTQSNGKERANRRGVTKARAKLAFGDTALDREVSAFDLTLLGIVKKDRKSALYLRYFP